VQHEPTFEMAWAGAAEVPGWLTRAQAQLLWEQATRLGRDATLVEIGSHQGRSTVVLGTAAEALQGQVVAIDPFVEGRLFGGASTKEKFLRNIAETEVAPRIELVEEFSTKARPAWTRRFDYLYIDGKHDYWTLSDDLRWSVHLPEGGPVLVHDCFSSIGVTLGILRHVLFGKTLRYLTREGSLALFCVGRPGLADRVRILAELPWWFRNVFIKVLLRLRLRGVARRFGHDSPYDPY
jgi:predicted O-methyltransferase YrrM